MPRVSSFPSFLGPLANQLVWATQEAGSSFPLVGFSLTGGRTNEPANDVCQITQRGSLEEEEEEEEEEERK